MLTVIGILLRTKHNINTLKEYDQRKERERESGSLWTTTGRLLHRFICGERFQGKGVDWAAYRVTQNLENDPLSFHRTFARKEVTDHSHLEMVIGSSHILDRNRSLRECIRYYRFKLFSRHVHLEKLVQTSKCVQAW